MKKGLIFILGLLELLFVCFISFEFALRAIPNDFTRKQHYFNHLKDEVEILILGSSHAYVGINPVYMNQKAFNMAYSSQSIDLDFPLFQQLKNELPHLKTVVLPISYFSYVYALEDGNSASKIKNYNIYYGIYSNTFLLKNQCEVFSQSIHQNWQDLKKAYHYPNYKIFIDSNGFNQRRLKRKVNWEESAQHAVNNHTQSLNDPLIKNRIADHIQAIEQIIVWCKQQNIKVILLSTPVVPEYHAKVDLDQLAHWHKTTHKLTAKYNHVDWLNYFENDSIFTTQDFQDADHLNLQGAEKLTRLVNQHITKRN